MYELMKIDNTFFKPSNKSSLKTYFSKLKDAGSIIFVHNTFTKQDDNIEVTYESPEETSITIKIYPAGDGTEGRLRNEYLKTLQTISNAANKTIGFDQGPIRRVGTKYICNGFQAVSKLPAPK